MLENARFVLTVTFPDFLMTLRFEGLEDYYSTWAMEWYTNPDRWVTRCVSEMWEVCDDDPTAISICRYAVYVISTKQKELEKHFEFISKQLTYLTLPIKLDVSPLGLKGVVLWKVI